MKVLSSKFAVGVLFGRAISLWAQEAGREEAGNAHATGNEGDIRYIGLVGVP